jgi:biopolymer transport protein ExbD
MLYSAQRVRAKVRAAVRRREDDIEQDEIESGEINLIPYLDMVTNLMLFLLASISAGLILVQIDTTLPDKAPPSQQASTPQQNLEDQPLKLVVTITRAEIILWSVTGREGTLKEPHARFQRVGRIGERCDGSYMCESNDCTNNVCKESRDIPLPVFDYRALSDSLFEIATRNYNGKQRKADTYQIILMADQSIPYGTLVPVMAAVRCHLPSFGIEAQGCLLPTEDPELKTAPSPYSPSTCAVDPVPDPATGKTPPKCKLYDTTRVPYDPKKMALFHDILFSTGFE